MAKVLTTTGVSACIERIINESTSRISFVCPYVDINDRFKDLIAARDRNGVELWLLYGKKDLSEKTASWVRTLKHAKQFYLESLHAKCYSNESEAILTSMNLYTYSEHNNYELGILVRKSNDAELFAELGKEVDRLIDLSKQSIRTEQPRKVEKKTEPPKQTPASRIDHAFCIRCSNPLPIDIEYPYCKDCYKSWKRFEDPDYRENVCHICGTPNQSTIEKPVCYPCYQKYLK